MSLEYFIDSLGKHIFLINYTTKFIKWKEVARTSKAFITNIKITNIFQVINSSINILIYCWRDKKFLHIMLVTCHVRPKDSLPVLTMTRGTSGHGGRRIRLREDEDRRVGNIELCSGRENGGHHQVHKAEFRPFFRQKVKYLKYQVNDIF